MLESGVLAENQEKFSWKAEKGQSAVQRDQGRE
jgi:hypothetical protein